MTLSSMIKKMLHELFYIGIIAFLVFNIHQLTNQNEELQYEVTQQAQEIKKRKRMVEDIFHILSHTDHMKTPVVCRETDMTPREMLWILAEHLQEMGVPVEFH